MNASNTSGTGTVKMIVGIVFLILVLVALYHLYKYLFMSTNLEIKVINDKFVSAKTNAKSFAVTSIYPNIPVIYTGGEFTIGTWVYISDWQNVNGGKPKHIFTFGKDIAGESDGTSTSTSTSTKNEDGSTTTCVKSGFEDLASSKHNVNEQTLTVFLDAYNNELHTAVSLAETSTGSSGTIMKSDIVTTIGTGSEATIAFNGDALKSKPGGKCSVKDIELQKWILLTFCMNNKVLDIYMDGKLARSCVLPSMYSVGADPTKPASLKMAGYGGFGGFIGRTVMTNYAMNPEEVWKLYMNGPSREKTFWGSFAELFDPNYYRNMKFPTLSW